jgi:GT2 family glycosyltransferase
MMGRSRPLLLPATGTATGALNIPQAVDAIRSADVFDEAFYLNSYLAVDPVLKLVDPISHYLVVGHGRGFRPSADFDPEAYIARNPWLEREGMNPLLHFALAGRKQGTPATRGTGQVPPRRRAKARIPDFSKLRRPWSTAARPVLDVIMPVHTGFRETLQAIHAVLASRNRTPFELVVIDDKSPDAELVRRLQQIAGKGLITFLRNRRNLGFAGTVNIGLRLHSARDVILLNSDTKVHGNWLDRLTAHAGDGVATVTPFSNNASLCSYPRIFEANALPPGISARTLDGLCARLNTEQVVEVPTGVGFCLYVTRSAARAVGGFDERTFGKGYGEDNDFCFRALKRGFRNLHALDVFVFHEGGVSFGPQAADTLSKPLSALYRKHPNLKARLRKFAIEDPSLTARQLVELAVLTRGKKQVDFLLRGSPGEVLMRKMAKRREALALVLAQETDGQSFRIETPQDWQPSPNLVGLSLERLALLLSTLSRKQTKSVFTVYGSASLAPELKTSFRRLCRELGIGWKGPAGIGA